MGDKGLFPMRSHHLKKYNIFNLQDEQFEGRIFDRYRRVEYKTFPQPTVDKAIQVSRWIAELLAKGQCVPSGLAIHVDEGREIREKEEKEYLKFKKEMRKMNRENGARGKL
jgi:hypothetical protein